jgi:hypothetical protein
VKIFSGVFAFAFAGLIGLLSLSSVSSGLHTTLFHGDNKCPHSSSNHPCSSHDGEEEEEHEEELPCPVLLFAKGFLSGDFYPDLSFKNAPISKAWIFLSSQVCASRKHDPYGARDPPFFA